MISRGTASFWAYRSRTSVVDRSEAAGPTVLTGRPAYGPPTGTNEHVPTPLADLTRSPPPPATPTGESALAWSGL